MFEIEHYKTENGRDLVSEFIDGIANKHGEKDLANIRLAISFLKQYGLEANRYRKNIIKKMDGDLWELRPGDNRIFFLYYHGNKFVLLHGFRKQSNKTPLHEINAARKQMNDYIGRYS